MKVRLAALFGFVFGFGMAFVTLLTYGNSVREILSERQTTVIVTTSMGSSIASSPSARGAEPDLYQEVRIICMVLTHSENRQKAIHLNATWGKRCNRLIFISNEDDKELGAINIGVENSHDNLWAKTREAFRHVYENYFTEGDWFLKADDDTYIVMENLRYMLYGYDTEAPIYFGHKFAYDGYAYMSGGGGYVLSKESLRRFMTDAFNNESLCLGSFPQSEDFEMGDCLRNIGVTAGRSWDPVDKAETFYPLTLEDYIQPEAETFLPDWLYNRSVETIKTGADCCSEYSISFHYLEPKDMYVYDFILYRLRAHGIQKPYRALPNKASLEIG